MCANGIGKTFQSHEGRWRDGEYGERLGWGTWWKEKMKVEEKQNKKRRKRKPNKKRKEKENQIKREMLSKLMRWKFYSH